MDRQRRKYRKLWYVSLEDDQYEDMINVYTTDNEEIESDPAYLRKVRIQEEGVEKAE